MANENISRRDFLTGNLPGAKPQMTMRENAHGEKVSLLGFGMMRLPTLDGSNATGRDMTKTAPPIDQDLVNRQIDYAFAHGVNYVDTSPVYCYGESERVTGIALKRHDRDSFNIATKLSNFAEQFHTLEASKEMYEASFRNLQVEKIDYYLLHSIGNGGFDTFKKRYLDNGVLDFLLGERDKGRIRNLGFSFHGDPRAFEWCMENHPRIAWDFCQIQLNYVDWRHAKAVNTRNLNGEYLYSQLDSRKIPIVIMEPLLGGRLARFNQALAAKLKPLEPEMSLAEWAFRFAGHWPRVMTCLSGMTKMEHVEENCRTFSPLKPLSQKELDALEAAARAYVSGDTIPCTACDYCMPCPYGLMIPQIFSVWNRAVAEERLPNMEMADAPDFAAKRARFLREMDEAVPHFRQASHCVTCGVCARHCPQSIKIPSEMVRIDALVESLKRSI